MQVQTWRPAITLTGPVYLDSNMWVGHVIRGHRLYRQCAGVFGKLLASQTEILFSHVNYSEALWGIAGVSWCDVAGQPHSARFSRPIYRRWRPQIWQQYGARFRLISSYIQRLSNSGVPIQILPGATPDWLTTLDPAVDYMDQIELESTDAVHLALAAAYAKTFITADHDFTKAHGKAPTVNLTIVHVR